MSNIYKYKRKGSNIRQITVIRLCVYVKMVDENSINIIKYKIKEIDKYNNLIDYNKVHLIEDAVYIGWASLGYALTLVPFHNVPYGELIREFETLLMSPFLVGAVYRICHICGYKYKASDIIANLKNELAKNKIDDKELMQMLNIHEYDFLNSLKKETSNEEVESVNTKGGKL